ncbi:protein kinase [Streptomyces sp. NPDC088194]|uniref:protein kinase domain-containing protein n=1 Tax=Streptomyces sp. NPDC088194 TaxID=3154931 RepID=UPI00344FFB89
MGAEPLAENDPSRIGPFTLLGRLGSGGMGRVYLGLAGGRFAAVKQVHPHLTDDEGFRRRFGHELDNLARLPAGVSAELLDSDRESRPPWLATAHIPGITLDEALRVNGGPMPVADVWLLLREAAAGLAVVNEVGIVHRDLKPSNVMLRADGLTLIDFGVAMALEQSRLTQSGMVIGTPAYMSPEQASSQRDLTGATDVFALGCLLGYAATGQPPYGDGGGVQMLYRIIHQEPDLAPLRAVDAELATVVADCLAREPQDRPTAAELAARAASHVAAGVPPWPPRVRELLATRRESAKRVPEPEAGERATEAAAELPPGSEPGPGPSGPKPGPQPDPEPAPELAPAPVPEPEPERRRLRLPRVLVIPLVVVATGGAVALTPYLLTPKDHDAHSPSAGGGTAAALPSTGTSTGSATPSGSNSAVRRGPSPSKGATSPSGGTHAGAAGTGTSGTRAGSGSAGRSGGSSSGSGGSGGSKSSGSSGGSGGASSGSTGSSGSGATITASGTHRLVSALDGHCLAYDVNHSTSAYLASCGSSGPFKWTYAAVSGGTFELRNAGSGNCLAGSGDNFSYVVSCGSSDADRWKLGRSTSSGTTLQNVSAGQCLQNDTTVGAYATTTACGSSADLLWSND